MPETIIDSLYKEFKDVRKFLDNSKEISLSSTVDNTFKKTLALSAASYFEDELKKILIRFFKEKSKHHLVINFIENKAISRNYHTYFDWDSKNVNKFLALFGEEFKQSASNDIKSDENIEKAVKNFIDIGKTRNELSHLNFASIEFNKTAEEVYDQFKQALVFIEYFKNKLFEFELNER